MGITYKNSDEKDIVIDLPDGKKIHGTLRGSISPNNPITIIIHGRPGTGNELLQFLFARYLHEHNISSLRLFMYDFEPEYRNIIETNLDVHANDLDVVVNHLREQGVVKIFATGHSYGGLTILRSKSRFESAVLWDPTHGLAFSDDLEDPIYPETHLQDIVYVPTGCGYMYPEKQYLYDKDIGDNSNWASGKNYPIKYITAGKGILKPFVNKYFEQTQGVKSIVNIEEAHHQFTDNDKVIDARFRETLDWFNKL